jgi:hypothetical protein
MTTAPSNKIAERIRKILALTTSPNEHEALAAANMAHALLAEHNLTMTDVHVTTEEDEDTTIVEDETLVTKDSKPWRRLIGVMIAQMYFCKYIFRHDRVWTSARRNGYIRQDVHYFIGTKSNIAISKMMFEYLTGTVDRLAKDGARNFPPRERSSYVTSFRNACAGRLAKRIHERIEAAKRGELKSESGKNLPALLNTYLAVKNQLDAFIENKYKKLHTRKSRAKSTNIIGAMDGRAQGDKIGLDPQLNRGSNTRLLK